LRVNEPKNTGARSDLNHEARFPQLGSESLTSLAAAADPFLYKTVGSASDHCLCYKK
jgi:hypothetical protein